MPREIKDMLREGLPSVLYLKAYPEAKTINQISKEFYGKEMPANFYRWKKKFLKKEWIKRSVYGGVNEVLSKPDPLVEILKKEASLNENECKLLYKILDSVYFRKHLAYEEWSISKNWGIDSREGVDAPKLIFSSFSQLTASAYMVLTMLNLTGKSWGVEIENEKEITIEKLNEWELPHPGGDNIVTIPDWLGKQFRDKLSESDFEAYKKGRFPLCSPMPSFGEHIEFSMSAELLYPLLCLSSNILRKITRITPRGGDIIDAWERAFSILVLLKRDVWDIRRGPRPIAAGVDRDIVGELLRGEKRRAE